MSPPLKHRYRTIELPEEYIDLARRRTAFLFELIRRYDLTILFASAYLQGISDATETIYAKMEDK